MKEEDIQDTTNQPDLDSSGKVRNRAITSGEQAFAIASKLEEDQRQRNNYESIVDKKFNGGLPFDAQQLRDNQESWRNNFSTQFMSGIITKVIPQPVGLIDGGRYITSSKLCSEAEEATRKTTIFRDKITSAIRQWVGWKQFQYSLWTEVVLHGNAITACLDPYSPWPEMYRTDKGFVPVGTGQSALNVPFFAARKDYLVHEFVEFIKDQSVAEDAGWDTDVAIKAVNDALPAQKSGARVESRSYEDSIREGNPGASYSGARVIEVWHVLAVEPDTQKVTHYIVNRNGKHEVLFQKDDRFETMRDVITLFTLEPGNGAFYGSRGLGRILLNMHIACEANRNLLFDQLRLAGMTILKTDAGKTPTIEITPRHPVLIISGEGSLDQQPLNPNVQAFIEADNQLSHWAEQAAGSYISDLGAEQDGTAPSTATEEQIRARREQQFKVAFLARAWGQHSELVYIIQKRLIDPETTDPIAKKVQEELEEEGFTKEELKEFSESSTAEVVQDLTQDDTQKIVTAWEMFRGDLDFDQRALKDMVSSALVSPQFTKDTLLDEQGVQTKEVEAYRQQLIEIEAMIAGAPMPVSPRDPHDIHIKALLDEMKRGLPSLAQMKDPAKMDAYHLVLRHGEAHVQMMEQAGAPKQDTKPLADGLKLFDKALEEIVKQAVEAPQAPVEGQQQSPATPPPPSEDHMLKITSSISYKDAPESIKRQIEAAAGFQPANTATSLKERATVKTEVDNPASPVTTTSEAPAPIVPNLK